jgi:hypothetical protein
MGHEGWDFAAHETRRTFLKAGLLGYMWPLESNKDIKDIPFAQFLSLRTSTNL